MLAVVHTKIRKKKRNIGIYSQDELIVKGDEHVLSMAIERLIEVPDASG